MEGNKPARFEEVYRNEAVNMVKLATFFLGSRAEAEEAVHDAFIRLHEKWATVRNPEAFVKQTTVNRCKDLLRTQKVDSRKMRVVYEDGSHLSGNHYMVDLLQELEPKRRLIVVLKFYGGYKIKEISAVLDLPKGTVESNLHRGIEQLRGMMPDEAKT